jgi:hypothetical protein
MTTYDALVERARRLPSKHQAAFGAACAERALHGVYRAPDQNVKILADLVESLWDATNSSGDIARVEAARQDLLKLAEDVQESDYVVGIFLLFERAAAMALGTVDVSLVLGAAQDIVYDLVLDRYFTEQGIREGPYSNQDFEAKAAKYREIQNELQFECCILDKLERSASLLDFRREARACSEVSPVLWTIAW